MNDKSFYFITVFNRLDLDEKGCPDTGAMRPCGFYSDVALPRKRGIKVVK